MRMIGKTFEGWKVLAEGPRIKYRGSWQCVCICGVQKSVDNYSLVSGRSTSCGCLRNKKNINRLVTHGMSRTRLYRIWHSMLCRCGHNKSKGHPRYAGRGIFVCKKWMKFEGFIVDMLDSYNKHCLTYGEADTTIERADNDGGYNKRNCHWATRAEQMQNTYRSKKYGKNANR